MELTIENIHALATKGVGFNGSQLYLLCGTTTPKKGWLVGLVGTEMAEEQYARIMAMKGVKRAQRAFLPPRPLKNKGRGANTNPLGKPRHSATFPLSTHEHHCGSYSIF